jgi:hypothetical protein
MDSQGMLVPSNSWNSVTVMLFIGWRDETKEKQGCDQEALDSRDAKVCRRVGALNRGQARCRSLQSWLGGRHESASMQNQKLFFDKADASVRH